MNKNQQYLYNILKASGYIINMEELNQIVSKEKFNENEKCILLSRVSTGSQDLDQQNEELYKEANKLGFKNDNCVLIADIESGIQLSEEERAGLNKMKDTIEHNNISCVIVYEISRLSRRPKVLYSIRDYLIEHKVNLICIKPYMRLLDPDGTMSHTANILFSLFSSLSESEMMLRKERFLRAKNALTKQGKKSAGAVIFGYMKNEEKKCIADPIKSKIIVDIFSHYINTDSSLYETYIYISGKYPELFPVLEYKKAQHKIRHFFETEIYHTGNWCYPPLITKEMWDNVHDKMSKAVCKARYSNKRQLLCRGKIYCGKCGRMMTGSGGNTKAYCCSTDKLHSLQIGFDIADWIMWEETRTIVDINASYDSSSKIQEIKDNIEQKNSLLIQYENKLSEVKQKKDKLVDLYIKGIIDESMLNKKISEQKQEESIYSNNIEKLHTEINSYKQILEENQKGLINGEFVNVDNIGDFETRQEFVRKYIHKMIVKKVENELKTMEIEFEYMHPVISTKSKYLYIYKNQKNCKVYRINEDGTKDCIK